MYYHVQITEKWECLLYLGLQVCATLKITLIEVSYHLANIASFIINTVFFFQLFRVF